MDYTTPAYLVGRKLIKLYCRLFYHIDIKSEAVLPSGPKIYAINHPTTLDPFFITTLNREPLVILIHKQVFTVPVFGQLLKLTGNISVDSERGNLALDQAVASLKSGKNIAVFIEGGLSKADVSRPKTGAARLSAITGFPVVPIGIALDPANIHVSYDTFGKGTDRTVWYTKGPYALSIGKELFVRGSVDDRQQIREESVRILAQIKHLESESHKRLLKYPSDFSLLLHWIKTAYNFITTS